MTRMLKHVPTGDLYVYTDALMKRGDMELVPEEGAEVSETTEAPKVKSPKPRAPKAKPVEEPVLDAIDAELSVLD